MTEAPPSAPPKLGVIVVNYGSHDLVEANLAGLGFGDIASSVVIVDNFTTAEESRRIAEVCESHGWVLVQNERNVGFGAAMNAGVGRAQDLGCTVFLLLNPDATLSEEDLAGLYERSVADPLCLLSPRIVHPDGSRWFDGGTVLVEKGRTSTAVGSDSSASRGWLSGACLMVHDELWRLAGGFDDDYFLYWEDVDLSWRCAAVGGRVAVAHDLTAVHSVGGTQRGAGKSPTYVYYNCRNRLVFASKHLTRRQVLSWLASSGGHAYKVMLRGGRRSFLRRPAALVAAAIGGTVAGAAKAVRALPR